MKPADADRGADRMPPLDDSAMNATQKAAAAELAAGPRKGVKGPFIPLLRSPDLMARLQKVGEYLRFQSALSPRVAEFATLVVARHCTQDFEWFTHVPLALAAGTSQQTIDALAEGSRPVSMDPEEALIHDFVVELLARCSVSDATYLRCVERLGERGVIDLIGTVGYFVMISMVLNVARTPGGVTADRSPLVRFPG